MFNIRTYYTISILSKNYLKWLRLFERKNNILVFWKKLLDIKTLELLKPGPLTCTTNVLTKIPHITTNVISLLEIFDSCLFTWPIM